MILFKPLQCILRIPSPLNNLSRHICLPINPLLPRRSRSHIIQDTAQLVGSRGGGVGDLELEFGTLVLSVVGVVRGLVFGGGFGGDGCGLFKDGEGMRGGG